MLRLLGFVIVGLAIAVPVGIATTPWVLLAGVAAGVVAWFFWPTGRDDGDSDDYIPPPSDGTMTGFSSGGGTW